MLRIRSETIPAADAKIQKSVVDSLFPLAAILHSSSPPPHPIRREEFSLNDSDDRFPQYRGMNDVEEGRSPVPQAGVIIVDPFCDYIGVYASKMIEKKGCACIIVISDHMLCYLKDDSIKSFRAPKEGIDTHLWASELPFPIVGAVSESDAGVATAERLQAELCRDIERTGGINEARRDKRMMNEALYNAGIPSAEQCLVRTVEDAETFSKRLGENVPIVLKPSRGCASDGVHLCRAIEDIEKALSSIIGSPKYSCPGEYVSEALAQEYLCGTEYAVDTVSLNGDHKVTAVWKYDKRSVNGAPFVYFRTELRDAKSTEEKESMEYVRNVLDALNVRIGAAHVEVMYTSNGPKLIEYNGRWHLDDTVDLCNRAIGYNAIDATVDAYIDSKGFDSVPSTPTKLHQHCSLVHLVCFVDGTVAKVNHIEKIKSLPSFHRMEVFPSFRAGASVSPTVDKRTDAGWVHLCHTDAATVEKDYQLICELMPTMFSITECSSAS